VRGNRKQEGNTNMEMWHEFDRDRNMAAGADYPHLEGQTYIN
jgi:hypothetical protein